jgi:ATP-dependent helicase HrpA
MLFPGSGLFKNPGNWIVAAEMVETSRLFARKAAVVDVAWLEPLGGDLCRRSWSDPHWERSRGEVVAREQVTLFGLPIVQDRRVAFGRIDPEQACRHLCAQRTGGRRRETAAGFHAPQCRTGGGGAQHGRPHPAAGHPGGRRGAGCVLQGTRLPGVCDIRTLKHRIRKKGGDRFLRLDREMLIRYAAGPDVLDQFPRQLDLGHRVLACDYAFEPGTEVDGVTVTIPAETTGDVPREQLDWLVPGLLAEKITALIKGLPKAYRVKLVPVADTVQTILDEMPRGGKACPRPEPISLPSVEGGHPGGSLAGGRPAGPFEDAPGHHRCQGKGGGQRPGRAPAGPGVNRVRPCPSGLRWPETAMGARRHHRLGFRRSARGADQCRRPPGTPWCLYPRLELPATTRYLHSAV